MRKAVIAAVGSALAVPFLAVAPQAQATFPTIDRCTGWYAMGLMDQYNLCEQHSRQAEACTIGTQADGYTCCSYVTFCTSPK
jgi:hypothetical protein